MIQATVAIDDTALRSVLATLMQPDLNEVAAAALNDTAETAEAAVAEHLAPMMGLPAKVIEQALTIVPASAGHLEADLIAQGKAIKMIVFQPRASKQEGVVLHIAGKDEQYRHAFIATVRHDHVGVFERKKGARRLPIRELYGPSVPGMLARSDVLPAVLQRAQEQLGKNLVREVEQRARRKQYVKR
jgi:hypothetical protein